MLLAIALSIKLSHFLSIHKLNTDLKNVVKLFNIRRLDIYHAHVNR